MPRAGSHPVCMEQHAAKTSAHELQWCTDENVCVVYFWNFPFRVFGLRLAGSLRWAGARGWLALMSCLPSLRIATPWLLQGRTERHGWDLALLSAGLVSSPVLKA